MNETPFASVLNKAREARRAVGAFTCYNFEEIEAVVLTAETSRVPVIVLIQFFFLQEQGRRVVVRRGF